MIFLRVIVVDLGYFVHRIIFCSFNNIPDNIQCNSIKELIIVNSQLNEFPEFIYNLTNLKILNISCNNISKISSKIKNLDKLQKLSIINNRFTELPNELFKNHKNILIAYAESIHILNGSQMNKVILTCEQKKSKQNFKFKNERITGSWFITPSDISDIFRITSKKRQRA